MAIAILAQDGQQFLGADTSRVIPFTVPQGAHCLLVTVACADFGGSGSVAQVDWDGDAGFTRAVHRESSNAGHHAEAWVLANPAPGSGDVTVTYVGLRGDDQINVYALSGVDTTDMVGGSDTADGHPQTVNMSLTTQTAGSLLVVVGQVGGGVPSPMTINTSGWTVDLNTTTDAGSDSNAEGSSVVGHTTGGAAATLESFSGAWAADPSWNGAFVLVEVRAGAGGGVAVNAIGASAASAVGAAAVPLSPSLPIAGLGAVGRVGFVGVAAGAGIAIAVAGPIGTAFVGAIAAKLGATAAASGLEATAGLGPAAFFEWRTHEMPAAAWVEEGAGSVAWLDVPAAEGTWS